MKKDSQASLRINPDDIGYAIAELGEISREQPPAVPHCDANDYTRTAKALRDYGFDSKVEANFDEIVRYRCAFRAGIAKRGLCLMGKVGTGKKMEMGFIKGGGYWG